MVSIFKHIYICFLLTNLIKSEEAENRVIQSRPSYFKTHIMKTKFFVIAIALLFVCTGAKAQDKVRSLTLGFAPMGFNHVSITLDDEEYHYDSSLILLKK